MINKLSLPPKFLVDRYKKWKSSTYLENELELRKLASFMMDMHKIGKVALTQKKISGIKQIGDKGDIVYLYIAQRRKNAKQ